MPFCARVAGMLASLMLARAVSAVYVEPDEGQLPLNWYEPFAFFFVQTRPTVGST